MATEAVVQLFSIRNKTIFSNDIGGRNGIIIKESYRKIVMAHLS